MKPKRASDAPPLDPACVAIGLEGWSAKPRDGSSSADTGAAFDLFMAGEPGVARRWREHEGFLRGEAKRLHVEPAFEIPGRAPVFFGELLTLPQAVQIAHDEQRMRDAVDLFERDDDSNKKGTAR